MPYESIDKLQNALGEKVFHYTRDKKKAAGRALGTMVEIITYYLLKTWGFNNSTSIEKGLVEYGNEDISHNVEYSLHPIIREHEITVANDGSSITATKILRSLGEKINISKFDKKNNNLLDKHNVLRNACTIGESEDSFLLTSFKSVGKQEHELLVFEQMQKTYAIFECKRVGVEEGTKKGPQTIEKAKQGAYVARTVSSLQKIRTDTGEKYGIIYRSDNEPYIKKDDMRNICESPCFGRLNNRKRRERQQAKDADRPEPKGEGYGQGSPLLSCATCDSPGG